MSRTIAQTITLLAGFLTALGAFLSVFFINRPIASPRITYSVNVDALQNQININTAAIANLQNRLASITSLPPDVKATIEVAQFKDELRKVEKDISALNDAIMASPANALSVPLVRRDVEELSRRVDNLSVSVTSQATAVIDQFRWIIGTIAFGMLALVLSNFVRRPGS